MDGRNVHPFHKHYIEKKILNGPQADAIQHAHQHLVQLVKEYNSFELTTHNWEDLVKLVENMEVWFDFLRKSGVELTRDYREYRH